jgi:hypothetical protein
MPVSIGSFLERSKVGHWLGASDRRAIALIALVVRLVAFAGVSAFLSLTDRDALLPDERQYLRHATSVARGGQSEYGYANFLGTLFRVIGESAWLPRAINVLAGTILALVVYELLKLLTTPSAARRGGLVIALWPSLIVWSATVLRDSILLLAIAFTLWGFCVLLQGDWRGLIPALVACALIQEWRVYAFFLMVVALVVGAVFHLIVRRRSTISVIAFILGIGVIGWVGGSGPFGIDVVERGATLDSVSHVRTVGSDATTGFATPNPRSVGDVIEGIPKGFLNSMFGPFPWGFESPIVGIALLAELMPWYALLFLAFGGLRSLGRGFWSGMWLGFAIFVLGAIVVFSVYGANSGTILRQRAMLIVPLVSFAAVIERRSADEP